jgi:hypothetical protein
MDPVTHALTGWLTATACGADVRTRSIAMAVAVAPDLDWAPLLWGGPVLSVHRVVGHNLWVGLPLAAIFGLAGARWWRSAGVLYLAFLSHLAWDAAFTVWPQKLLWPLSGQAFGTIGWSPLSLPYFISIAVVFLTTMLVMHRTGFSPLEMLRPRAIRE